MGDLEHNENLEKEDIDLFSLFTCFFNNIEK